MYASKLVRFRATSPTFANEHSFELNYEPYPTNEKYYATEIHEQTLLGPMVLHTNQEWSQFRLNGWIKLDHEKLEDDKTLLDILE